MQIPLSGLKSRGVQALTGVLAFESNAVMWLLSSTSCVPVQVRVCCFLDVIICSQHCCPLQLCCFSDLAEGNMLGINTSIQSAGYVTEICPSIVRYRHQRSVHSTLNSVLQTLTPVETKLSDSLLNPTRFLSSASTRFTKLPLLVYGLG